jgi:hypothetical protein
MNILSPQLRSKVNECFDDNSFEVGFGPRRDSLAHIKEQCLELCEQYLKAFYYLHHLLTVFIMFNLKQLLFSSALVVAVYGQNRWSNLTEPCKQAIKSARKPTGADCALPRNRTDADTERVCRSLDSCVESSKQLIKQGCANEMSLPPVDFMLKYGVEMKFKSKCLKDGSNKYCRKSNQQSFCGECMTKRNELQQQVMANAPQDVKDRASKWQDKKSKCSNSTSSSGPRTDANAMSRSDATSTFTVNSVLFISTFSAFIYTAVKFW